MSVDHDIHKRIAILDRAIEMLEPVPQIDGSVTLDVASTNNPTDRYEVTVVWVTEPSDEVPGVDPVLSPEAQALNWMTEAHAPISPVDQRSMILSIEILRTGRDLRGMMRVEAAIMDALFGPRADWKGLVERVTYQGTGAAGGAEGSNPFILCAIAVQVDYSTLRGQPGALAF